MCERMTQKFSKKRAAARMAQIVKVLTVHEQQGLGKPMKS